ncbi:MAG: BBP7 family outer membrane beta-barrel protein [Planctomycetes bacterium]|nr:BBP7 family outer membrane beta-barrel protein [Planctomycetota bacterium]
MADDLTTSLAAEYSADSASDGEPSTSDAAWTFDEPYPWFSIRAGAIALHRSEAQSHVLLSEQATGETLLDTFDAPLGWGAGPELNVLVHLTSDVDFEFNWFSINDWSNQRFVDVGGVVVDPFGAPLTSASLLNQSSLHNFEFNLRHSPSENITLLAGFRYLELDDELGINYEDSGSGLSEDASLRTRNRLYGVQIGAEAALWQRGLWQLDGWIKAGAYGNAAGHKTDVLFSGVPVAEIRARESNLAFIGDTGLRATRQLGEHTQFYVGYRVMFLDGVALAANQYDSVAAYFSGGGDQMTTGGSPFYHGAELGLTVAY